MMRKLEWWEIQDLERRGCTATDWADVKVHQDIDLSKINHVRFEGPARLGRIKRMLICAVRNCEIGDDTVVRNVTFIDNARIGSRVVIENSGLISYDPEATCGVGVEVSCLDETGSNPVCLYPGLSAQLAAVMARRPKWVENRFRGPLEEHLEKFEHPALSIGDEAQILNVRSMKNVIVGREVVIDGASRLVNGRIVNNAEIHGRCLAFVGSDVDAENFIIEDGVVDGGSFVRNCYVGQGAVIDKRFTAHDSLFFANTTCENGEACAVFAGPYTVTMHKSTLLIGAVTSFMNAGSGTNQSNHMYKLGPVHWGVMERGVKTSSDSYIMWGARIGAFSLLMGPHKNHPDSSQFPFSYLFGDSKGATSIVPGKMLHSCGLMRDELKWPTRDRRLKRKLPMHDRINFAVLNPMTVDAMLDALELIPQLLSRRADDDLYIRHNRMKMRPAHLDRAVNLYTMAIFKYLHSRLPEGEFPEAENPEAEPEKWVDLAGQIVPRSVLAAVMDAESVEEAEKLLDKAYEDYDRLEREWMALRLRGWKDRMAEAPAAAAQFDAMVEEDRSSYRESIDNELKMLDL